MPKFQESQPTISGCFFIITCPLKERFWWFLTQMGFDKQWLLTYVFRTYYGFQQKNHFPLVKKISIKTLFLDIWSQDWGNTENIIIYHKTISWYQFVSASTARINLLVKNIECIFCGKKTCLINRHYCFLWGTQNKSQQIAVFKSGSLKDAFWVLHKV